MADRFTVIEVSRDLVAAGFPCFAVDDRDGVFPSAYFHSRSIAEGVKCELEEEARTRQEVPA